MAESREAIVVDFPLRAEWTAYHTPAEKIPSHGTDQLGQRYAYDFVRIDREHEGWRFCRASMGRYHVLGAPLDDFYAWGAPIHSPFDASALRFPRLRGVAGRSVGEGDRRHSEEAGIRAICRLTAVS